MARSHLSVGAGHHLVSNILPYPIPLGRLNQYVVNHFKWHEEAVARLEWGLAHADRNPMWQRESRRFLDWLNANGGKINVGDPEIGAVQRRIP